METPTTLWLGKKSPFYQLTIHLILFMNVCFMILNHYRTNLQMILLIKEYIMSMCSSVQKVNTMPCPFAKSLKQLNFTPLKL